MLNNTALGLCEVATAVGHGVKNGRIVLHTLKTGELVDLPLWPESLAALNALPVPRGTEGAPRHYFWNGKTSRRCVVGIAERTLAAVFKASGVPSAHAHRFRHTLATKLLGMGASDQEVADVLGNSPAIVRKHYAKWSRARQQRIDGLMKSARPSDEPAAKVVSIRGKG